MVKRMVAGKPEVEYCESQVVEFPSTGRVTFAKCDAADLINYSIRAWASDRAHPF